ncbi:hypothetical protein H312_00108, partial [Anncaliia algerae PRA339]
MNLLNILSFVLCRSVPKLHVPTGKLSTIKTILGDVSIQEDTESTINVTHEGRELEFNEDELESVQKYLGFLKKYDSPFLDASIYENLLKIQEETEEETLKNGRTSFVILFVNKESVEYIKDINNIRVFLSTDEKLAQALKTPFPGIYGYNHKDRLTYQLKVKNDYSKAAFSVLTPILDLISNQNVHMYESSELPTFYLLAKEENLNKFKEEIKPLSIELKNEVQMCLMKYSENTNIKAFGITQEDLPAVIIVKDGKKYAEKSVNKETLRNFIGDYNENKLNEYILSQEELPNNDSLPVKRITFNNSEKYLKDPSKDKFVIFEAPWCQYCKLLKPIVNDLAEIYKDNANILVGTYDMTENDPLNEYHIRGYPTLFLIKGETNEIKQYTQKERDLKSLADFIKNEGHYKVDITEKIKLLGD